MPPDTSELLAVPQTREVLEKGSEAPAGKKEALQQHSTNNDKPSFPCRAVA